MDMTTQMQNDANARQLISDMVATARAAQTVLAESSHAARRAGLTAAAKHIRENVQALMTANAADLEVARTRNQSAAMIDRLTLNDARIEGMAAGLEAIATLPDPLGATLAEWTRPNGLNISRISTPLGIIGVIYEARPNVTIDAGGLCVISGNAVILRAGSDSQNTSSCLAKLLSGWPKQDQQEGPFAPPDCPVEISEIARSLRAAPQVTNLAPRFDLAKQARRFCLKRAAPLQNEGDPVAGYNG